MNIARCSIGNPGQAGGGGIVRDHQGHGFLLFLWPLH